MVPRPGADAQQRRHMIASHGAASGGHKEPGRRTGKAPLITYARSSKPLSVTGTQFARRAWSTHDLPSDDDVQSNIAGIAWQYTGDGKDLESRAPVPDDPISSSTRLLPDRTTRVPTRRDIRQTTLLDVPPFRDGTAQAVHQPHSKAAHPKEPESRTDRVLAARIPAEAPVRASKSSSKHPNTKLPARRLPVNELFCVASLPDDDDLGDPPSSIPGIDVLDAIIDQSRHDLEASESGCVIDETTLKAPLTSTRKLSKSTKYRHKSLAQLRHKQRPSSLSVRAGAQGQAAGDGFELSELEVTYRSRAPRQSRKCTRISALTYGVLQLCGGPMPDVTFERGAEELPLEQDAGPHYVSIKQRRKEESAELPKPSTERSRRTVSFSGRNEFIVAQLSSVTAPRRHHSDSEDESEEDDDEFEVDEERSSIDDTEAIVEGFVGGEESGDDSEPEAGEADQVPTGSLIEERNTHMLVKRRPSIRFTQIRDDKGDEIESGVGIYHRNTGVPSALCDKRRRLIEVDEAIEDIADNVVYDRGSILVTTVDQHRSDGAARTRRTRSILKNSTPLVAESAFHPKNTAVNTRRNSQVAVADSRYFAAAAQQLHTSNPARHIIVPRRQSRYFDETCVQVPDSERAVPETSPEPHDYANGSQLAVLRRTSEAVWTSVESLPRTRPRDLGALTRSVSREHGTMSQSMRARRRPSLPYRSPTKVVA
ncbi:hypothetical protein LTR91_016550 [Friedmanniomyces endolithicus]|uniref:Uncharacterized protein n=1 Tax=Friedmanniomyces endolithicus TaxID=329885 RepID=A0AAN6K862_9PEZI|nr:hypothetical protein LTR94_011428 [Friedmanniomyces endolithicus]KAK0786802.1 hypothetical protein LTR59_010609 [Friedmanniomyces endolithicus]KAK0791408.1 hypothetical protein LTR75_011786 [Friedmanniomyces endolithicus]KAK0792189.1 hypothetical protein LTR38_009946 [Friedmanniomyces endolithicus]KAK0848775.1 hypothetical protein LTR03_005563 [Friedmanniomyces endolithicus]